MPCRDEHDLAPRVGSPGRVAPWAALACAAAIVAGCQELDRRPAKSPLKPLQMSHDSVVLDIFFVRVPLGDAEANGALWEEVDEQHFPAELRQRLARNGFRVGLVGGQIPAALSKLLEMKDKPAPRGNAHEVKAAELEQEPKVVRRHSQVRPGQRTEIQASGVYDELPVLTCESRGLCGKTYQQAQGVLIVQAKPVADGRVQLDLLPEIQFGESRLRSIPTPGGMRLEPGRSKKGFDDLALQATLLPGHLVVLTGLPDRPGSLGYQFFTQDNAGKREQKLMIVRVSQTQHDDLFDPQQALPLEQLASP